MSNEISNSDDVIDSRDVIARIEELEETQELADNDNPFDEDDKQELISLKKFANQCEGYGDWEHGETLIRDSYFKSYAQELAEECCEVPAEVKWPYTCIDWDMAARELQHDYTSVEFDGVTYWMRS